MSNLSWVQTPIPAIDKHARTAAEERQQNLTKPAGSLGLLEDIAVQLAAIQGTEKPQIRQPSMSIFAGDHGVCAERISLFPQEVTQQMILNFSHGGAAICQLCRAQEISLEVINCGCASALPPLENVIDTPVAAGTENFKTEAAMSPEQCLQALDIGKLAAERANDRGCTLFMLGEMGIGNTTAAAAVSAALLQRPAIELCGRGTGLDAAGVQHKAEVIEAAFARATNNNNPLDILAEFGGFEIAAMTGACLRAAQLGMAVLVDGFIVTSAVLVAEALNASIRPYLLFAHQSEENGHRLQLEALDANPIYRIGMRLGEGSAAALALNTVRLALEIHANMATFAEAGVSNEE